VERARAIAVLVYGSASLTLSDVVVRDPLPNDAGIPNWQGRAIEAHMGARVDASRVLAVRAEGIGVWARGADTEMNIDDSVILDVSPGLGDGDKGWAVSVTEGARATFHRLRAERLTEVALQVQDAETSLMIEDVVVRDVAGSAASERLGSGGLAISAFDGASVGVSRAIFERMSLGVVLNDEGTNGTFADVVVRYMTGEPRGGSYGRAMTIQFGAHALIQRAVLEDVRELALGAVGGEIEASDLVVRGVRGWLCSPELCGDPLIWAMGVGAYDGGHLEATRFSIADAVECGVQVGSGSSIDLHDGEVSRNRVGANVQEPTFDVARISDGVRYFDNELNLDATMQPVPDAYQPVAE